MRLLLDTPILGQLCHPRRHQEVRDWLRVVVARHEPLVPEVCDYELRRELLRLDALVGVARLDELGRVLGYVAVTTKTWREAATLWAARRRAGRPSAAAAALDADIILAALAIEEGATVVTPNARHFDGIVDAVDWSSVPLA